MMTWKLVRLARMTRSTRRRITLPKTIRLDLIVMIMATGTVY